MLPYETDHYLCRGDGGGGGGGGTGKQHPATSHTKLTNQQLVAWIPRACIFL